MPVEDVLAANAAFYAAFSRRDPSLMEEVWAKEAPVACLHPGWEPLVGRDAVLQSWRGILLGGGAPAIRCERASAHLLGDVAYVLCIEQVPAGQLIATNVFVLEQGRWRMVHHHSSPIARRPAPPPLRN